MKYKFISKDTFQVMAESTNSSLVVAKEHPNLCYLLSSCSRWGLKYYCDDLYVVAEKHNDESCWRTSQSLLSSQFLFQVGGGSLYMVAEKYNDESWWILVYLFEILQTYGRRGGVYIGTPQLPRCQILHPVHGRLQAALPRHPSLQVLDLFLL